MLIARKSLAIIRLTYPHGMLSSSHQEKPMAADSKLSHDFLHDDAAALAHLEARLWPNGPVCPHCGAMDRIYGLKGKSTRPGVRKRGHCRKPFTVTVGTVFERSHVPLHKWMQAGCL